MTWDISGHDWAVDLLKGHIRRGEVRHAYLFSGPAGIGKRTLALRFAQALNCPAPLAPGEPCRTCRVCRQIEQMSHVDLSVVQSEGEGMILKVDQARELQQTLAMTPRELPYRTALLLRFHEANASAQNALLKTLEEPPSRAILLITATSPEDLLPTIVSRCEVLRLRPLAPEACTPVLMSHGIPEEKARLLAHLAGGRPGYALTLHEQPALLEARQHLLEDLLHLLSAPRRERFAYAERLTASRGKERERLLQALTLWLSFWRDILLCASGSGVPLTHLDYDAQVQRVAQQVGLERAASVTRRLEENLQRLESNPNMRLLAEITLLEMPRLPEDFSAVPRE